MPCCDSCINMKNIIIDLNKKFPEKFLGNCKIISRSRPNLYKSWSLKNYVKYQQTYFCYAIKSVFQKIYFMVHCWTKKREKNPVNSPLLRVSDQLPSNGRGWTQVGLRYFLLMYKSESNPHSAKMWNIRKRAAALYTVWFTRKMCLVPGRKSD